MFHDHFRAANERRDFRNGFKDQMQVADGNAFGEQQLQHRLQARIGNMRRADIFQKLAIFRAETVQQNAHILVGKKLGQIVADDFAQMCQQD